MGKRIVVAASLDDATMLERSRVKLSTDVLMTLMRIFDKTVSLYH